jgi:hypothetical protein
MTFVWLNLSIYPNIIIDNTNLMNFCQIFIHQFQADKLFAPSLGASVSNLQFVWSPLTFLYNDHNCTGKSNQLKVGLVLVNAYAYLKSS